MLCNGQNTPMPSPVSSSDDTPHRLPKASQLVAPARPAVGIAMLCTMDSQRTKGRISSTKSPQEVEHAYPARSVSVLNPFERLFHPKTWRKAQLLAVGAILAPHKRTVTSALNILGIGQHGDFAIYHHVLNRARWSSLKLSRVLLLMVVRQLCQSDEPLVFGIDETIERRWGRKIAAKGVYRDPTRSTERRS